MVFVCYVCEQHSKPVLYFKTSGRLHAQIHAVSTRVERENLDGDAKGKGGVMAVERRERVIAIWLGSTGNGRNPMFNGRRQPSCGGTSRMTRECQVRFCERLGVIVSRRCESIMLYER
jgi:hypothetical protein